jgi:hypothetical protein
VGQGARHGSRTDRGLIFYRNGKLLRADVATSPKITIGIPKALFQVNLPNVGYAAFAPLKDGRILVAEPVKRPETAHITVIVNWTSELGK